MVVKTGNNECGEVTDIAVPVRYGSTDRVASAIGAADTQNKLHTLPMMSVYLTNIELAPERMHGVGTMDRRTYLEQGGVYPDDLKAITRIMPVPYNLTYELGIYASNTEQAYQIIEQILILFDYTLQVQMDDSPFNWARQTMVELQSINNEENYPVGPDRRAIVWTLSFKFDTWLSLPMDVRKDIVSSINISLGNPTVIDEIDEDGNLAPFDPDVNFGQITLQIPATTDPADPGSTSTPFDGGHFNASLEPNCPIQAP